MSSNISTFYDKIIEVVGTDLFPTKKRLPNPYFPEQNPGTFIKDGWGFKISPSTLAGTQVYHSHIESREFSILLTKKIYKLKSDQDAMDTPLKGLLEDNKTLSVRLLNVDQLGIPDAIVKIDFSGNSGLEFLNVDKNDYILTETTFTVDIMEDI